jgi:uncharacterized protein
MVMGLEFDWDPAKARTNLRKHRVSFREASTIFGDPYGRWKADPDHSEDDERWILIGLSEAGRLLTVVFTERGDIIRLISARRAEKREQNDYQTARKR